MVKDRPIVARKMNTSNESSIFTNLEILSITGTTINLVLGVPINSWVLWLVFTGPAGTMASEFFTLNLSVCEIFIGLLYLTAVIMKNIVFNILVGAFLLTGRPVFQCCICVERFMAVVHPVLFLKYKPLRYRVACSALAWLVVVGVSLLHVLLNMLSVYKIASYIHLVEFVFFLSVMLLCSLAVLRALIQPRPGETGRERERDNSMKTRAFIIICLIMGAFLGSYLLLYINVFFYIQGRIDNTIGPVSMLIAVVTGFVQPLLYICQKTGKLSCVNC